MRPKPDFVKRAGIKPKPGRKFEQGDEFREVAEMLAWGARKGNWFWMNGRPVHPSWVLNMTLITLIRAVSSGALRRAVRIQQGGS